MSPADSPLVVIVPYDPRWPEFFERARSGIAAALGDSAVAIEHVGSTSVPGLAAKPIIDIVVLVRSFDDPLVEPLTAIGYEYLPPERVGLPFRRYFRRHPDYELAPGVEHSGYHVHGYEDGNTPDRLLDFRDRLRANPDDAAAYQALKLRLAERYQRDLPGYTEAKGAFIAKVLASTPRGS